MDTEIVGGVPVVNGKEVSFSSWANQVYWPGTTKTVVDVVATKEEAAAEAARVDKRKRPNDIRTYPVKAGQTIHAGDVVDVVGGEANKAGTPSQAIALQDAASGQPCEVIFDGVAELPGFAAGTEINSPGVYGYCPEDGRVWVRPEWDGGVVTGKYVGNYSSSAPTQDNKIALGFRPRFVLVSIPNFSNLNVSFTVDEGTTSNNSVKIVDDGFTVSGQNMNQVNGVYGFAAFK